MEFHISRAVREKLQMDDLLFSYTGNVLFADVSASRKLAQRLNELRSTEGDQKEPIRGAALFSMGLIDELSHAMIARYRKEVDPGVLTEALRWFEQQAGAAESRELLSRFAETFPSVSVFRGELSATEWLKASEEGLPNREAAVEELLMLWLANLNPAFTPFRELFEDKPLREGRAYETVTSTLPAYFETRPPVPEIGTLLDALRAPMLASPDSLAGQLDFIREHWAEHLGDDLLRTLLAIDVLREEDIAIWMRFHPAGPDNHRHGEPKWGAHGFVGDEYVGFDEDFVVGADGVRRPKYSQDHQAPLNEYEAFSPDQAWMPNVVLMAKSTYVWLEQLSKKYGRHIHRLDQIPDEELKLLADRGITALWLIGLWERSSASQTIKRLRGHSDAVASAYSLKEYRVAEDLGGDQGYEHLRDRAAAFGLRLASDMVPNHMGIDSTWAIENPDWFLWRPEPPFPAYTYEGPDLSADSRVEIKIEDHYFDQTDAAVAFRLRHHRDGRTRFMYHGNDGTTFAWNDTAQLDYSKAEVREHVIQTILHVARLFPIIRFDAAMTLAKRHVQRLWFPLPGVGGSIPSRAENAMSQEQFDALIPNEFWREVVDRVAAEVPGTLLLAEAFWMLEGYFVRTLGMHRVYNSAFMNMLRDEENAKYRSYLKKTIEFDPDILKRYVNFMSNPDERTAIDQFGNGDKCFGVATLMCTLPGLPMFGHGQIEGFTERYGMEFKRAKMDETPDEHLVARHQRELAPLLKNRALFADSSAFLLYDFWHGSGTVDENVFAYSNRSGGHPTLVLYNNAYGSTEGTVHVSAASVDKGSGEMRTRTVSEGLAVSTAGDVVLAYRDVACGLEFLVRASDLARGGFRLALRGYQYAVLMNWRELRSSSSYPWDRLCDQLKGSGVANLDKALARMKVQPLHQAVHDLVQAGVVREFVAAADRSVAELEPTVETPLPAVPPVPAAVEVDTPPALTSTEVPDPTETGEEHRQGGKIVLEESTEKTGKLVELAERVAYRIVDYVREEGIDAHLPVVARGEANPSADLLAWRAEVGASLRAALALPVVKSALSSLRPETITPETTAEILPGAELDDANLRLWMPILAWSSLRHMFESQASILVFDRMLLRDALAESFLAGGMDNEGAWRAAARVRLLLGKAVDDVTVTLQDSTFWEDGDVRWLTGVNTAGEVTYFQKEGFEALFWWMLMPRLLEAAVKTGPDRMAILQKVIEGSVRVMQAMETSGYDLDKLKAALAADEPATTGGALAGEEKTATV